ncbi:MAG TPA: phage tail tape measure protein [Verrucomicrobiae bacterium]|jgi:TP901 family phage tail tape measure protein|nr:phage tail tape measure protein [Verrucomicrobiae bacterium]
MGELLDAVELRVTAPKLPLPGLEEAHRKLVAISGELQSVQNRINAVSTSSAFTRTAKGIEDVLKQFQSKRGKGISQADAAKMLGFDPKDVRQYFLREQEKLAQAMSAAENKRKTLRGSQHDSARKDLLAKEKKLQSDLQSLRRTFEGQNLNISGAGSAAKFFSGYQKAAVRSAKDPVDALRALFGGGGGGAPGTIGVGGGKIDLIIPASQITATIGPGPIGVNIPAGSVSGGGGGNGGGGGRGGKGGKKGGEFSEGDGALIEERTVTTADSKLVSRKNYEGAGETVENIFKEVEGQLEQVKQVSISSPARAAKQQLQQEIAGIRAEMEGLLAGTNDPRKIAAIHRKQAQQLGGIFGSADEPSERATEFEALGLGTVVSRTRGAASKLEGRGSDLAQKAMRDDLKKQGAIRKALAAARAKGEAEEAARLNAERRANEKRIRDHNRFLAAGQRSTNQAAAQAQKVANLNRQQAQAAAYKTLTYQGADSAWADFMRTGGRQISDRQSLLPGGGRRLVGERETNGRKETMTVTYDQAGAKIERLTKAMSESRKEGGYLASDFIKNTAKVATWAASVGVLYKSLELVTYSMGRLVDIGPQVGRLDQVFKGVGGSAMALTEDIIGLAAANGSSTEQAMEAAIQWSRLGLTRVQVNEAVRVSLMAANVAQIDALEATEKMQAVMQAYGLDVSDLRSELGQIVQISNSYNVTNEDMLQGLSRVAAVARQAGLPLAELQGILGATIGGTGQSGSNIGNMMKSVILSLSNPDLQKKLRQNFKFETSTGGEEIKGMSALLSDLFVKYQHLNQLQRQSLLFTVGGKTQSSRLEAMLDGYIKAQILAVNAQLHLNTAEQENAKIVATLKNQLKGLTAEWEKFVVIQGSNGPAQAMTATATAFHNLLSLANTPAASWLTTAIGGLLAAGTAKSILTGLKGGDGFLGRSQGHIRQVLGEFNGSMMQLYANTVGGALATNVGTRQTGIIGATRQPVYSKLYAWSEAAMRVGRSSAVTSAPVRAMATAIGGVTRALGAGLIALQSWFVPLVVTAAGIYAFNKGMEMIGLSSEKAEAKLAGFNEEAQKAGAAANAYAEAADALATIQRAVSPEKGFQGMKSADQKKYLSQASELVGLYEPDIKKQQMLQDTFRKQTAELLKQGDIGGVINLMDAERNKLGAARREELQKQFVSLSNQQRTLADEIERLQAKQRGSFGRIGYDARAKSIVEKQTQLEELNGNKVRNFMDQSDAYEKAIQYDEKYQSAIRAQKLLWESMAEIFDQVNANNPIEKSALKVASLQAQNEAIKKHIQLLDTEDAADTAGQSAKEKRLKELDAQEQDARQRLAVAEKEKGFGGDKVGAAIQHFFGQDAKEDAAASQAKADIESINAARESLNQNQVPGQEGLGFARRQAERSGDIEQNKKNQAEIDAIRRNKAIIEAQAQAQFGREEGRRETTSFDYGRDETQKLQHRRDGIRQRLNQMLQGPQTVSTVARELELQNQLYQTQIELRNRSFGIERDINQLIVDRRKEFEHSLLSAGPAEMLRKLAALSMGTGGKMSPGQFLALSPDMRKDLSMVDPRFDPQMMDLMAERNRGGKRPGEPAFDNSLTQISTAAGELAARLQKVLPDTSTYDAAAANVSKLAGSAGAAADALDRLTAAAGKAHPVPGGSVSSPAGSAPKNAQSGGNGGGAGFIGKSLGHSVGAVYG